VMLQHRIYDKPNLRMIVEAMLYRMRVGCPWRDLPSEFGCWNSIYQRFNRWSLKGKLITLFKALVQEPDLEWPGGRRRLPAESSHRSVRARISAYGSSNECFATLGTSSVSP
jgi:transposase